MYDELKARVDKWVKHLWSFKSMDLHHPDGTKLEDQRGTLVAICEDVRDLVLAIEGLEERLEAERARAEAADEVAVVMCERAGVSPDEAVQLGIAAVVRNDAGEVVGFKKRSIEDALSDAGLRAGELKFRQLKQYFRSYQDGVKVLLSELDGMAGKNTLSTSDLNRLLDTREQLRDILRREF